MTNHNGRGAIAALLARTSMWLTAEAVAVRTGVSRSRTLALLREMHAAGEVARRDQPGMEKRAKRGTEYEWFRVTT